MNRLVLIGNGFDLAHGLKTSYKDFINWYWEYWGHRLLRGQGKELTDGLCSFTLKDEINLNSWSYVWGFHYQREDPFKPWDLNEVVKIAKGDEDLCEFKYIGRFLESICNSFETKGWADIENEYYSLLLRQITLQNTEYDKEIEVLNKQLEILRNLLIDYLKQEQEKELSAIDAIKDKIYNSIDTKEISVTNKNIENGITWDENKPWTIMLLNFNYTKTSELYVTDPSNIIVNYIHGRLDDPKSVIFGYGDELDEDYKKLQNLNDNEYLRHIKSIRYLESDNYRKLLEFIEAGPFQIIIMGHSCGNSDRTLLNTLFEHDNCVSIKPYYYINEKGEDNYIDIVQNISRNFTDMKKMRDRVVNKTYCEPLVDVEKMQKEQIK